MRGILKITQQIIDTSKGIGTVLQKSHMLAAFL